MENLLLKEYLNEPIYVALPNETLEAAKKKHNNPDPDLRENRMIRINARTYVNKYCRSQMNVIFDFPERFRNTFSSIIFQTKEKRMDVSAFRSDINVTKAKGQCDIGELNFEKTVFRVKYL